MLLDRKWLIYMDWFTDAYVSICKDCIKKAE